MIEVIPMEQAHLESVYQIEVSSFSIPWTKESIANDFSNNKTSIYIVAMEDGNALGYAGMWHVVTEGHITNIAVHPDHRARGIGGLLLDGLVNIAKEKEMIGITLEVRVGNRSAMGLYNKYGFKVEGYRKNYYQDSKEDAVVMWKYL